MRAAAVAGSWYPAEPQALASTVDALLDAASEAAPSPAPEARGLLVPHSGLASSGPTAARAYAGLRGRPVERVVLLGPAHFVLFRGCRLSGEDAWRTPLGAVPVDRAAVAALAGSGLAGSGSAGSGSAGSGSAGSGSAGSGSAGSGLAGSGLAGSGLAGSGLATVDDRPHRPEHALEVQLPFLQRVLSDFTIVPIAVGVSDVDSVARVLLALPDERTVVICSSDLSHHLDRATAAARDARTLGLVTALDPSLHARDACGVYALRGMLGWARAAGLEATLLDRSDGGAPGRVVGFGAVAFTDPETDSGN